jgi:hypothetical protein
MSSKQYREFARECLRWAEESASEEDRRHFMDMAKAWMQAAAEVHELSHQPKASPLPGHSEGTRGGTRNVGPVLD